MHYIYITIILLCIHHLEGFKDESTLKYIGNDKVKPKYKL